METPEKTMIKKKKKEEKSNCHKAMREEESSILKNVPVICLVGMVFGDRVSL